MSKKKYYQRRSRKKQDRRFEKFPYLRFYYVDFDWGCGKASKSKEYMLNLRNDLRKGILETYNLAHRYDGYRYSKKKHQLYPTGVGCYIPYRTMCRTSSIVIRSNNDRNLWKIHYYRTDDLHTAAEIAATIIGFRIQDNTNPGCVIRYTRKQDFLAFLEDYDHEWIFPSSDFHSLSESNCDKKYLKFESYCNEEETIEYPALQELTILKFKDENDSYVFKMKFSDDLIGWKKT